jgi:hypothetical protein
MFVLFVLLCRIHVMHRRRRELKDHYLLSAGIEHRHTLALHSTIGLMVMWMVWCRSQAPQYRIIVQNRKSDENLVHAIHPRATYERHQQTYAIHSYMLSCYDMT